MNHRHVLTVFLLAFALPASGGELDRSSQEGLQKTQKLLRSKSERQGFINQNSDAKKADKKVDDLTNNPQTKEDIYAASSDIFSSLVKSTDGDAGKQMQVLEEAMKNPEAFYNKLTPAQKSQIQKIADKIQKESPPNSPPE